MQSYKKLLISSVLEYGFNVRNFIYNEIGIVEDDRLKIWLQVVIG